MAIAEIIMPKMGESITEATILRWHKKVGDHVKMDETLLDIATDKVDSEVPSTAAGVIKELVYDVNDVVPVGGILARIETEVMQEVTTPVVSTPVNEPVIEAVHASNESHQQVEQVVETVAEQTTPEPEFIPFIPQPQPTNTASLNNRFFSPLVLNIANSEGLSLSELERIPGTGADGRVSKKDVLQYIADKRAGRVTQTAPTQQQSYSIPVTPIIPAAIPEVQPKVVEQEVKPAIVEEIPVQEVKIEETPIPDEVKLPEVQVQEPEIIHQKAEVKSYPINVKRITDEDIAKLEKERQEQEAALAAASIVAPVAETIEEKVEEVVTPVVETVVSQEPIHAETPISNPIVQEPTVKPTPAEPAFNPANYKNAEIIEMDRMRKLIAKHMVDSKQTSPHVTSFTEADVTNMVTWRNSVKHEFEKREGMKITFTPMFIECILKVMKQYPIINSSVVGDKIIMKKDFNIGMATALPTGNLIVPVIKNAADMNFISLTRAVNTLADNARKGKLSPDDVTEGTFTFTNVGTFGSLMGTPIINQPQVAILAVGEIKKRPVVVETDKGDFIGIRHMMYLSLSYDHRIIDGSIGASFLSAVAKELEAWDVNRQLKYVVKEWYVE
jgi:2-oxoglutarate dehydrogenase E2 component (dihydrolipoamide succinyltransferase)